MVYLYPKTIQTSTGRSAKHGTQQLSNPQALCSNSTNLAYWGVKNPTWKGNYMRNWPDSLTSYSGSYNKPEVIYGTGFEIDTVPQEAKLLGLTVEYKWEQISYSSTTAFGKFQKPSISIMHGDTVLGTIQGAAPEANRYNNNKVNQSKINTDNAELATLHSHSFNIASHGLKIKDLKNIKIKFNGAANTSSNHLRLVMQFLRINLTEKDYKIDALCRLRSSIDKTEATTTDTFQYTNNIYSSNGQFSVTNCNISIPADVEIINIEHDSNSTFDTRTHIWTVNNLKNNNAEIIFTCKSQRVGTKNFSALITNNADSINYHTNNSINIINKNVSFQMKVNKNLFKANLKSTLAIDINLVRSHKTTQNESIIIDTDGLITDTNGSWSSNISNMSYINDGKWEIKNINFTKMDLRGTVDMEEVGDYTITATHKETNMQDIKYTEDISVIGDPLSKEYFKLRVEDGTDIQYNSLTFTEGDDLVNPLTYEIEDDNTLLDNLIITGETRKLPVGEAKYIQFSLELDTDEELSFKNVLATIEANNGQNPVDIVLGGDDDITFFESSNHRKFFTIDEINSNNTKTLKFIIQSDVPQTCELKIIIFNEDKYNDVDSKWTPAKAIFANIPSIKLSIEGTTNDLMLDETDEFTLYYIVENQSNISAKNLNFKIEEPVEFQRLSYQCNDSSTFNSNTRIWHFDNFATNKKYKLTIKYKATKKGIYQFVLKTFDKENTFDDDQYKNEFIYHMMVDINSIIDINTYVSKSNPFVKELIDFNINFTNYIKQQKNFTFDILDIGQYDILHDANDYEIEYWKNSDGVFTPNTEDNNIIGQWYIDEIDVNKEYDLTLTLKPTSVGTHVIRAVFDDEKNQQNFDNFIRVFENNHKIAFNVEHAVYDGEEECPPCKDLISICDDDFINIEDDIYYLFTVTNNENGALNNLTVYARLPQQLLQLHKEKEHIVHNIVCYPKNDNIQMQIDENTGLVYFNINKINKCETKTFCIKLSSKYKKFIAGEYISYFGLTMRNARVKTKQLFLTVDNTYTKKKLEHEVTIYNFEKTHRYFRYEIDGSGNLFKFFNQKDRSLRTIDVDKHNINKLESYKGTNLRQLYRDIKNNSKYVEPELLRIGTNAFDDRGYELYPDGFMRRFGLLNSEIFHYTGQLPQSTNLVDYAMKWDIDEWDTKVWAGGLYQNGVFDISVDYSKIPTNFNILDPSTNPIKTLQALVDKTKPFGTKGIAYYSNTTEFDLNIDFDVDNLTTNVYNNFDLELDSLFGLISWYNRHDNSIAIYHDLTQYTLDIDTDTKVDYISKNNHTNITPMLNCSSVQYDKVYNKKYIEECSSIIQQLYNNNNTIYGISVTKPDTNDYYETDNIIFNQDMELYCPLTEENHIILTNNDDKITIQYVYDEMNNINGFQYICNNKIINQINYDEEIYDKYIRIEYVTDTDGQKIFHFWVKINNKDFYHLGYYTKNIDNITTQNVLYRINHKQNITFKINDTNHLITAKHKNIYSIGQSHKWNYLKNINNNHNQYAYFANDIDIDKECKHSYINTPKIMLQYPNLPIKNTDEITDISVKINAHSNKENLQDDININIFKNGNYYMPTDNMISDISYPNSIYNTYQIDNTPTFSLSIKGITICSNCLHTSLGYYDNCPYCKSNQVTHFEEQQEATVCYNCGWMHNGWYDKCNHCLSRDVEKVMVDVNQTYCNDCKTYTDDYYPACPKCFSDNVTHTHNNDIFIQVSDKNTQNIEPIDIQSNIKRLHILDINVPLDSIYQTDDIEHMFLNFDINNNNDGQYYYCESCERIHLGNSTKCEYCQSEAVHNYIDTDIELQAYIKYGSTVSKIYFNEGNILVYGDNQKTINLLDCIKDKKYDSFTIMLYVENINYDSQSNDINKIPATDKNIDLILKNIQKIDIRINNISIDSKYINEKQWENIDNFYYQNHKPISYQVGNESKTNILEAKDFNFNTIKDLSSAHLYLHGLNQSNSTIDLLIKIIDKNKEIYTHTIENIPNGFFNEVVNLIDIIPLHLLQNITIQLQFSNINNESEIFINDIYILTQKNYKDDIIYHDMTQENIISYNQDDEYIFKHNDLWNINTTLPHYLDGNQINNGLLCYIDFGTLDIEEYIRIYNIELLVTYQNKKGKFITDYFPISFTDNEKMINGNIISNMSNIFIETKTCQNDLSNLEYDIFNNTHHEDSLSAMPLRQKICQSFVAINDTITQVDLQYFGHIGYPNKNITLKLYNNYNNQPNDIISEYHININTNVKQVLSFELDAELNVGETYWLVLEDKTADDNNYHRFRYNKNIDKGILITEENNAINKEGNYALSYAIYSSVNISQDYKLPMSFTMDDNDDNWYNYQFKNYYTLYRYNINKNSNLYLSNLSTKYGYKQNWE